MRNIQEIFDAVIAGNFYNEDCVYMCLALENAIRVNGEGGITADESNFATSEIMYYLFQLNENKDNTLHNSLFNGLGKDYPFIDPYESGRDKDILDVCMPIYKDWENRPRKK